MWKEKTNMKKNDTEIKAYMGEDTIFNGLLNYTGTVRIDGKFEGQVITEDTLIIGETGHLTGEISAGTIICLGYVESTVMASQKIEIHSTSKVVGTIKTPGLHVEVGGVFDGTCDMTGKETKIIPLVKAEEIQAPKKT